MPIYIQGQIKDLLSMRMVLILSGVELVLVRLGILGLSAFTWPSQELIFSIGGPWLMKMILRRMIMTRATKLIQCMIGFMSLEIWAKLVILIPHLTWGHQGGI